ncbi:hypothetical protein EV666_11179 [Camelimonas lactis]|uniref:Uncharacterized protein n=1 Tax=Camelimonas lactis TaxID=659006 RepID=A0A4R2GQF1_9HYPH|nr:hypothetical protein EV666_11179 [Camelimonas lactis]
MKPKDRTNARPRLTGVCAAAAAKSWRRRIANPAPRANAGAPYQYQNVRQAPGREPLPRSSGLDEPGRRALQPCATTRAWGCVFSCTRTDGRQAARAVLPCQPPAFLPFPPCPPPFPCPLSPARMRAGTRTAGSLRTGRGCGHGRRTTDGSSGSAARLPLYIAKQNPYERPRIFHVRGFCEKRWRGSRRECVKSAILRPSSEPDRPGALALRRLRAQGGLASPDPSCGRPDPPGAGSGGRGALTLHFPGGAGRHDRSF